MSVSLSPWKMPWSRGVKGIFVNRHYLLYQQSSKWTLISHILQVPERITRYFSYCNSLVDVLLSKSDRSFDNRELSRTEKPSNGPDHFDFYIPIYNIPTSGPTFERCRDVITAAGLSYLKKDSLSDKSTFCWHSKEKSLDCFIRLILHLQLLVRNDGLIKSFNQCWGWINIGILILLCFLILATI